MALIGAMIAEGHKWTLAVRAEEADNPLIILELRDVGIGVDAIDALRR